MTEEIRKAFELTCYEILPKEAARRIASANGKYNNPRTLQIFDFFEAGIEHQQKRIDKLTTALKEIKKATGGSSSDGVYEMDAQLGAIWSKADEVLKEQNND